MPSNKSLLLPTQPLIPPAVETLRESCSDERATRTGRRGKEGSAYKRMARSWGLVRSRSNNHQRKTETQAEWMFIHKAALRLSSAGFQITSVHQQTHPSFLSDAGVQSWHKTYSPCFQDLLRSKWKCKNMSHTGRSFRMIPKIKTKKSKNLHTSKWCRKADELKSKLYYSLCTNKKIQVQTE